MVGMAARNSRTALILAALFDIRCARLQGHTSPISRGETFHLKRFGVR